MADFKVAYVITMGNEGGYANNPNDKGKETYKGISRLYNPDWAGWTIIDEAKKLFPISKLDAVLAPNQQLQDLVLAKYKTDYWDVNELDLFNSQAIANEMFDTGVNMGTATAAKFLQRAINITSRNQSLYKHIKPDGDVGGATLRAINNHPKPAKVHFWMNMMQASRYVDIMENTPSQEEFANSWASRIEIVKVA